MQATIKRWAAGPAIFLLGMMLTGQALAQEWQTSSSLLGESKYGKTFQRYDYVNPDAPKGGTLHMTAPGTFDSFNPYIVQGSAAAGLTPYLANRLYDSLMDRGVDEDAVSHAMIADAYKHPDDYSSATYRLDPRARWHDGKPITVEDVIWSFTTLKRISPNYTSYFGNVTEAIAVNDREVEFRFDQKGNRELPKIIGDLVVLPKHWWEGTDANGKKRDITRPTLEPPLGSGAYKIASFKAGTEIVWERVPDYWGANLPPKIGRENFERIRYTYFTDSNAEWQAFTKGGISDYDEQMSARDWTTKYEFPAFKAGDVVKKEFLAKGRANFQGFVMNTRRPLFQDRNVRKALTLAYDFDTTNKIISSGLNKRVSSYFVGSELASSGIPQGKELELLTPFKDQLPPELFTEPFTLPVYAVPKDERTHLQAAIKAFGDAGWHIKNGRMTNDKTGQRFEFEMLGFSEASEIHSNSLARSLQKIGVTARLRIVDATQYVNRIRNFDYDMITTGLGQTGSPGNEQREYWSTKAADSLGSRNFSGIKNPVVDALVEKVIFAEDREDLVTATNALDRVLLWNYYVIPQFTRDVQWLAFWNKFGIPEKQPDYLGADVDSWWIDTEKEKALAAKYGFSN